MSTPLFVSLEKSVQGRGGIVAHREEAIAALGGHSPLGGRGRRVPGRPLVGDCVKAGGVFPLAVFFPFQLISFKPWHL